MSSGDDEACKRERVKITLQEHAEGSVIGGYSVHESFTLYVRSSSWHPRELPERLEKMGVFREETAFRETEVNFEFFNPFPMERFNGVKNKVHSHAIYKNEIFASLVALQQVNEIETKGLALLDPVFFKSESVAVLESVVKQLKTVQFKKIDDDHGTIQLNSRSLLSVMSLGIAASTFPAFFTRISSSRVFSNYRWVLECHGNMIHAILKLLEEINKKTTQFFNFQDEIPVTNTALSNALLGDIDMNIEVKIYKDQYTLLEFFDNNSGGDKYLNFMRNMPVPMPYVSRDAAIAFLHHDFGELILPSVYSDTVVAKNTGDIMIRSAMVVQHGHPLIRSLAGPFLKNALTTFDLFSMGNRDPGLDVFHSLMFLEHLQKDDASCERLRQFEIPALTYEDLPNGCIYRSMSKQEHYRSFWTKSLGAKKEVLQVFSLCKESEWDGLPDVSRISEGKLASLRIEDPGIFDPFESLPYIAMLTHYNFAGEKDALQPLIIEKGMTRASFSKGMKRAESMGRMRIAMAEIGFPANTTFSKLPSWLTSCSETYNRNAKGRPLEDGDADVEEEGEAGEEAGEGGEEVPQEGEDEVERDEEEEDDEDGENDEDKTQAAAAASRASTKAPAVKASRARHRPNLKGNLRMGNRKPSSSAGDNARKIYYPLPKQKVLPDIDRQTTFSGTGLSATLRKRRAVSYNDFAIVPGYEPVWTHKDTEEAGAGPSRDDRTGQAVQNSSSSRASKASNFVNKAVPGVVDVPHNIIIDGGGDGDHMDTGDAIDEGPAGDGGEGGSGTGSGTVDDPIDLEVEDCVERKTQETLHRKTMTARRKRQNRRNPFSLFKRGLRVREVLAILANSYLLDFDPEMITAITEAAYRLVDLLQRSDGKPTYNMFGHIGMLVKLCTIASKHGKSNRMTLSDKRLFSQLTLANAAGNGEYRVRDCCESLDDSGLLIPELLKPSERGEWYKKHGSSEDFKHIRQALRLAVDGLTSKEGNAMHEFLKPLRGETGVYAEDIQMINDSKMEVPGFYYDRRKKFARTKFDTKSLCKAYNIDRADWSAMENADGYASEFSASEAETDNEDMEVGERVARDTARHARNKLSTAARRNQTVTRESREELSKLQNELADLQEDLQRMANERDTEIERCQNLIGDLFNETEIQKQQQERIQGLESKVAELQAEVNRASEEKKKSRQLAIDVMCNFFKTYGEKFRRPDIKNIVKKNFQKFSNVMTSIVSNAESQYDEDGVMGLLKDGDDGIDVTSTVNGPAGSPSPAQCKIQMTESAVEDEYYVDDEVYREKLVTMFGEDRANTLLRKSKEETANSKTYKLFTIRDLDFNCPLSEFGMDIPKKNVDEMKDSMFLRHFEIKNFKVDKNNLILFTKDALDGIPKRVLTETGKLVFRNTLQQILREVNEDQEFSENVYSDLKRKLEELGGPAQGRHGTRSNGGVGDEHHPSKRARFAPGE